MYENVQKVKSLIKAGADVNTFASYKMAGGQSAIFMGVYGDVVGKKDWTALHFAVQNQSSELLNLLLEHGANPNKTESRGNTPLHYAALVERKDLAKSLLEVGADVNLRNDKNKTPMKLASDQDKDEIVNYLRSQDGEM